MRRTGLLAGLIALGSTTAFAVFPNNGVDTTFKFVGQVGPTNGTNGSGTVISPNHVITAKHVGGMRFYFRNNGVDISGFADAVERIEHPTADLAILRFNTDLGDYIRPYYDEVVAMTTIVGFGLTATPRANGTGYDLVANSGQIRRSTVNMIDARQTVDLGPGITSSTSILYDLDGPTGNGSMGGAAIAGEGGQLFGDSGGAWLRNIDGGWRIVGVTSFIFDNNGNGNTLDWGDGGGAAELFTYRDWVEQHAPVPEPATMAAMALGLAALARRRRK